MFDDMLPSNRKWRRMVKKSPEAACLWVASICYSARYLLDGRIPKDELDEVGPFRRPEKLAELLAEHTMFEDGGDAWVIHDYLKFNRSAVEVEEQREKERVRKAAQRKVGTSAVTNGAGGRFVPVGQAVGQDMGQDVGQDVGQPLGLPPDVQAESHRLSTATCPIPALEVKSMPPDGSELFEPWWLVFPKRNGRKIGKEDARKVWHRLKPDDISACLVAVNHYARACETGETLAQDPHRWLTKRRWVDWQQPAEAAKPPAVQYTSAFRQNPNR